MDRITVTVEIGIYSHDGTGTYGEHVNATFTLPNEFDRAVAPAQVFTEMIAAALPSLTRSACNNFTDACHKKAVKDNAEKKPDA